MADSKPRRITSGEFEIDYPAAGDTVPVVFGTIKMWGVVDSSEYSEVRVWVTQNGSPYPAKPPRRAVPAPIDDNQFRCELVPWAKSGTGVQNTALAWARKKTDGSWIGPESVDFNVGDINVDTVKVSAKNCIWFTWAGSDLLGPDSPQIKPREVGRDYRPVQLPIPETAASLTINASGEWGHCGGNGCESDADGRAKKELLKISEYRSEDYNSQDINQIAEDEANLNRLVGVWIEQHDDGDYDDKMQGAEISVGKSNTFNLPSGADKPTRMALGLHDSFEWSDNKGELSLQITWTEE